jgi:hypothetical protein
MHAPHNMHLFPDLKPTLFRQTNIPAWQVQSHVFAVLAVCRVYVRGQMIELEGDMQCAS